MEPVQKTMKREYAVALMLFVLGLFMWGLIAQRTDVIETAKYLTFPVLLFNAAAFGLDAAAKQFGLR